MSEKKATNKFDPTKNGNRKPYPETRPGIKTCAVCRKEFSRDETVKQDGRYEHLWRYKKYCSRKCMRVAKSRLERKRLKEKYGTTDPFRQRVRQNRIEREERERQMGRKGSGMPAASIRGDGWFGMTGRTGSGLTPLPALPPEAKTRSVGQAMHRALKAHDEFLAMLGEAYKEQRGFKTRVRRAIKEARTGR